MNTTMRFNITLPLEIAQKLKLSKNHSRVIAESLRSTFAQQEHERLDAALAEGYQARAKSDAALNQEFDHLTSEGIE